MLIVGVYTVYDLFSHRVIAKMDVSKETNRYKRYVAISGLHCADFSAQLVIQIEVLKNRKSRMLD